MDSGDTTYLNLKIIMAIKLRRFSESPNDKEYLSLDGISIDVWDSKEIHKYVFMNRGITYHSPWSEHNKYSRSINEVKEKINSIFSDLGYSKYKLDSVGGAWNKSSKWLENYTDEGYKLIRIPNDKALDPDLFFQYIKDNTPAKLWNPGELKEEDYKYKLPLYIIVIFLDGFCNSNKVATENELRSFITKNTLKYARYAYQVEVFTDKSVLDKVLKLEKKVGSKGDESPYFDELLGLIESNSVAGYTDTDGNLNSLCNELKSQKL